MRLDVPDLDAALERDIEQLQPWMHPYHFGGPVYTGVFKYRGLEGVTYTTSGSAPELVGRMRAAFEAYMDAGPFHELDEALRRIVEATGSEVGRMRILDIASATGRYSFRAAQLGAAEVTGVEIRPEQVEQAQLVQRVAQNLAALPIRFVHDPVSADDGDYRAGERYGVVLSLGLLYHLRDPLRHLQNVARLAEHGVVLRTAANLNGRSGLWSVGHSDRTWVTKSVEGFGLVPYFRDLPELLRSVGFKQGGLVEHPLVRGLRPPLEPSPLHRAAYLVTPPALTAVAGRARARRQKGRRLESLRRGQSPFYFTFWAAR